MLGTASASLRTSMLTVSLNSTNCYAVDGLALAATASGCVSATSSDLACAHLAIAAPPPSPPHCPDRPDHRPYAARLFASRTASSGGRRAGAPSEVTDAPARGLRPFPAHDPGHDPSLLRPPYSVRGPPRVPIPVPPAGRVRAQTEAATGGGLDSRGRSRCGAVGH